MTESTTAQAPPTPPDPRSEGQDLPAQPEQFDLKSPELYLNRELTWLAFNERVLFEACDPRTPLLERVNFLSIVGSNLDEFVMKRIGGLKQQVGAGLQKLTPDGRTPQEQIDQCFPIIADQERRHRETLLALIPELREHGIQLVNWEQLTPAERTSLREYYVRNIFPLVTPQAVDPAHPFPFISNLSLNLLVTVRYPGDSATSLTRIKVPIGGGIDRFVRVNDENCFIPLEDVVAHNLDLLLPGMDVESCELFRVTRNANTERDEERADDLLAMIVSELRDRKFAPIVRMEIGTDANDLHRGRLAAELNLDEQRDVFDVNGMMALRHLRTIAEIEHPDLHHPPHSGIDHPLLPPDINIFRILRERKNLLVHHPYVSFVTSVQRFLKEASTDPKVQAIKMTLYRTSEDSRLVDCLIDAARNGKQVTVVVELKARFDEAANIRFANRLEEAGIHVTYGVVGYKTHCKTILVVRNDYDGLRRYAHFGTGNYHAGTSRIYCDLGLFTCDEDLCSDLTELFNFLTTGYSPKRVYRKLLPAPRHLKKALLAKIDREIQAHSPDSPGLLRFKMNALEDVNICRALYRASRAGVRVELIVRDTCRLRPGIPGLSDNITVISIVGRFLEHTRVYYFRNGGDEEYYIGSADCMKRNLEHRVETLVPVDDPDLRQQLREMLEIQLYDRRSAWDMQPDGSYVQRQPRKEKEQRGTHNRLIRATAKLARDARKPGKRKPQPVRKVGKKHP